MPLSSAVDFPVSGFLDFWISGFPGFLLDFSVFCSTKRFTVYNTWNTGTCNLPSRVNLRVSLRARERTDLLERSGQRLPGCSLS